MSEWSLFEVDLITADYFSMLGAELANRAYNKTEHRNRLLEFINRNHGSIEFKHQNISAVLRKLGLPFIKGYKPLPNYQALLAERVIHYLATNKNVLEPQFIHFAQSTDLAIEQQFQFTNILDTPPEKQSKQIVHEPEVDYKRRPFKTNYLQLEQLNSVLGTLGERFVLEFERNQLINLGKEFLSEKVEWVAQYDDSAGFDILSKNADGSDKYIEVKTTKLSKETPIFFSKNEYEFAKLKTKSFNLYRLFNFSTSPKMFIVHGAFDDFCYKEAVQFKGTFD